MVEWKPGAKELQTRSLPRRWTEDRLVEPRNRTRPSMGEVAAAMEGRLVRASDLKKAAGLEDTAGFKVGAEAVPVDVPAFGVPIGTRPTKGGRGRPKAVGPKAWELMVPPISKAEYYRRKKGGAL